MSKYKCSNPAEWGMTAPEEVSAEDHVSAKAILCKHCRLKYGCEPELAATKIQDVPGQVMMFDATGCT